MQDAIFSHLFIFEQNTIFCITLKGEILMAKAEYRSAIRSKRLIIGALADLLQEKPLDKITVTDIVNKAQINRGTFYAHYADIPDVINYLIMGIFVTIEQAISEEPKQLSDIPHVLLQRIQSFLEEDMEFCKKVMNSGAANMMQEKLIQFVLDYMLQHEHVFGFGDHRLYELTIRFCAGGLGNLYRDWFAGKLDLTLDQLTREAESMVCRIIESIQKGH